MKVLIFAILLNSCLTNYVKTGRSCLTQKCHRGELCKGDRFCYREVVDCVKGGSNWPSCTYNTIDLGNSQNDRRLDQCQVGNNNWPQCKGIKSERLIAFQGKGGESLNFLSHAFNRPWMQTGNKGDGEVWRVVEYNNGQVSLEGTGGEAGKYL